MFSLTRREQLVLVLILAALVTGAGIRHFRLANSLSHGESLVSTQR